MPVKEESEGSAGDGGQWGDCPVIETTGRSRFRHSQHVECSQEVRRNKDFELSIRFWWGRYRENKLHVVAGESLLSPLHLTNALRLQVPLTGGSSCCSLLQHMDLFVILIRCMEQPPWALCCFYLCHLFPLGFSLTTNFINFRQLISVSVPHSLQLSFPTFPLHTHIFLYWMKVSDLVFCFIYILSL